MIFVPDVCNFCAFCVHVWCAPTRVSYSPEHGDIPRYPNLAKIPKIRRYSSLWSGVIFLFEEKKMSKKLKMSFCSVSVTKVNLSQQITIRMLWNRNMMLTSCMRPSGSLLMIFWKIFDGRMKIFWNFMTFSSGHRKYRKKSSEVIQGRFNISLETYFGFMTFWWVFSILS